MKSVLRLATGVVAVTFALVAAPAHAQWMWKDEGGHVIASDMPPPTGTPASRIMKSPRTRPGPSPAVAASSAEAPKGDAAKAEGPKTVADQELEFKKREKERAEAAKKSDDDASKAQAMKENCTTVRGNLAGLQAGGRTSRVNERGERTYLDDAARAAEVQKAQTQITQYCK